MPDDVEKRLRYFNGQFLQQEDFSEEQAYHLDRLRRHNRQQHTAGLTEGLVVTADVGDADVVVGPGSAVDGEGRQIVLAESRPPISLGPHAGDTVLVVISYAEEASDPAAVGASNETRWHERPVVEVVEASAAPPADTHIRLTQLVVNGAGTVASRDDNVRVAAGVTVGDQLTLRTLALSREGVAEPLWPTLSSGATGRVDVAGDLRVAGDIGVTGTVDGRNVSADGTALDNHTGNTGNPHGVTAAQVGALASIEGVSNPGGNVNLVNANAITISGNNAANTVTIGENHSSQTNNPHNVTAAQLGALASIEGVSNPGGNVNLVNTGAITIGGNNAANTVTIGENHSGQTNNPHNVTAAQVGALDLDRRARGAITFNQGSANGATSTITAGFRPRLLLIDGYAEGSFTTSFNFLYGGVISGAASIGRTGTIHYQVGTGPLITQWSTGNYRFTAQSYNGVGGGSFLNYNVSPFQSQNFVVTISAVTSTQVSLQLSRVVPTGNSMNSSIRLDVLIFG